MTDDSAADRSSASKSEADAPATVDGRRRWWLLLGASLASVSLAAYEIVPASVTPLIRSSLGVDSSAAGLIVAVMFGTAVLASIPVGIVLDRTDSRVAMAVAVLALLVAGTWGWNAARHGNYRSLLASRAAGGVAYTVVWNGGIDVVSRSFSGSQRATAVGVFTASGPVGFALGQASGPLVASAFGWPVIFLAYTAVAVVGLAVFWPASRGSGHASGDPPSPAELGAVLTDRRVWTVGGLGFLGYALYLFANSWVPSHLTQNLGLSLAASGALTAVFPAVGVLSRISGGVLSDRLFGGRRRPVVLLSFLVATPIVAGFAVLESVVLVVVALLAAGFAIQLSIGLSFAYVRELVDPTAAATAVAFQTSVGLAGAFIAPIAGGVLIDRGGYVAAFVVAGALALVGVLLAWRAPEPNR